MTQPWNDPKWVAEHEKQSSLTLAKDNLKMAKQLLAAKEVTQCAQAVLTGLNVGHLHSESLMHKKLREVMIEYRKKLSDIEEEFEK